MKHRFIQTLGIQVLAWMFCPVVAPAETNNLPAVTFDSAVNVFLDGAGSSFDYLRSNISFVNFVRDRADCDVYVMITSAGAASGATEYTLVFAGKRKHADLNYTLKWTSPPNASEDTRRKGVLASLLKGLMPFVARTPQSESVKITGTAPRNEVPQPRDPWDSWVFSLSLSGYASGEKTSSSWDVYSSVRANRVTETNKIELGAGTSESRAEYETGAETVVSTSRSRWISARYVRSLGEHLSAGCVSGWSENTRINTRSSANIGPAIEYNIFPYADYAHRELDVYYQVVGIANEYYEPTIYGNTSETMFQQKLAVRMGLKREWGTLYGSVAYYSCLHDPDLYSLNFDAGISLSLGRGFSLELSGNYSVIHDQVYLPAGGSTAEEILLRIRQQETDYSYWASAGISYTFGSKFNNVVNPRF